MSSANQQLKLEQGYAPRFEIDVGGVMIDEADGIVSELEVDTTLDGADYFSFRLNDTPDREQAAFTRLEWEEFELGTNVEIAVGYVDPLEPVFVGRVTSVRPEFPREGGPDVTVSGYGLLHELTRGTNCRSWDETTDRAVVRDVASDYDLSLDIEDTGLRYRKVIQDRESDYHFLIERADRVGFKLFTRLDTLYFRAPSYDSDPTTTLRYGDSLSSFSAELNGSEQVGTVRIRHWNPSAKEKIVGTTEGVGPSGTTKVVRVPVESTAEANRIAESVASKLAEGLIHGRGEMMGSPTVRIGETVRIEGLGGRYTTDYYVQQVTHRIDSNGYSTTFEVTERMV